MQELKKELNELEKLKRFVPDYDADGIPDDQEAGLGLNPLIQTDAYSDADHDGLTFIAELKRGTDPALPDSDGDGRNDGQEVILM